MHVVLYFEYIGSSIGILILASHAFETESWFLYAQQSEKNILIAHKNMRVGTI